MKIKEIEERSGMSRANIRFYESEGLLAPERDTNGYRDYSEHDFEALQLMISELEDKYNFAFFSEGIKVGISLMSEASTR